MKSRNQLIDELYAAGGTDEEVAEALGIAETRGEVEPSVAAASSTSGPSESAAAQPGFFQGIGQRFNEAASAVQQESLSRLDRIKTLSEDTPGQGFQSPSAIKRFETAAERLPARAAAGLNYGIGAPIAGIMNAASPLFKGLVPPENPKAPAPDDGSRPMTSFGPAPTTGEFRQARGQIAKAATPALQAGVDFYKSRSPMAQEGLRGTAETAGYLFTPPAAKAGGIAAGAAAVSRGKAANSAIKSTISNALNAIDQKAGKVISELSDAPEEALRKYGTGKGPGAAELAAASGTEEDIAFRLIDKMDNVDNYIPESTQVKEIIDELPDINIGNTIQRLKQESDDIIGGTPSAQAGKEKIADLMKTLLSAADENGNIPAKNFRKLRIEIDKEIGAGFDKDYKDYIENAGLAARRQMADDLVKVAEDSGRPEYATLMQEYARKLQLVDQLKGYVGKTSSTRDRRIQGFIDNLFGKNKSKARETLEGLSDVFGENFLEQARNAQLAQSLGPQGKPTLFPKVPTGARSVGVTAGAALGLAAGTPIDAKAEGAGIGAGAGYLLSSPAVGARILAGTGALARMASRRAGRPPAAPARVPPRAPIVKSGSPTLLNSSRKDLEALAGIKRPEPKQAPTGPTTPEPYSADFTPPDIAALPKATRYNSPEAMAKAEAELQYAARGDQPDEFFTNPVETAMTADEERIAYELTQGGRDIETMTGTANALKRDFFKNQAGEVSLDKMDPGRRTVLERRIEDINTMHDTDYPAWAREYGAAGYPDKSDLSPDDIVDFVNRSAGKKPKGSAGSFGIQSPKQRGLSDIAALNAITRTGLGAGAGAAAGATQGKTPEESGRNAIRGAIGGAMVGFGAPGLVKMAKSGFKEGPFSARTELYAGKNAKGFEGAAGKFSSLTDKQPRFEIDDSKADISKWGQKNDLGIDKGQRWAELTHGKTVALDDLFNHDELFAQYPEMKENTIVKMVDKGKANASLRIKDGLNIIELNRNILSNTDWQKSAKETLLHEIQHAIQEKEGFASGGSANEFIQKEQQKIVELMGKVKDINNDLKTATPIEMESLFSARQSIVNEIHKLQGDDMMGPVEKGHEQYKRLAGEIEARDVSDRASMPPTQRSMKQPLSSQKIKLDDMIIRRDIKGLSELAKLKSPKARSK